MIFSFNLFFNFFSLLLSLLAHPSKPPFLFNWNGSLARGREWVWRLSGECSLSPNFQKKLRDLFPSSAHSTPLSHNSPLRGELWDHPFLFNWNGSLARGGEGVKLVYNWKDARMVIGLIAIQLSFLTCWFESNSFRSPYFMLAEFTLPAAPLFPPAPIPV